MDAAAFGTYGLLWFIAFVYMAAEWGEVTDYERDNFIKQNGGDVDTIQAAITFSFFAILVWVSICVCACMCVHVHVCVHACMCLSVFV